MNIYLGGPSGVRGFGNRLEFRVYRGTEGLLYRVDYRDKKMGLTEAGLLTTERDLTIFSGERIGGKHQSEGGGLIGAVS